MASCNFSGYPDENNHHFFLFCHARSNLLNNINDIVNLGSTTKLEDKGIFIIHVLCSKLQFTKFIPTSNSTKISFYFVNFILFFSSLYFQHSQILLCIFSLFLFWCCCCSSVCLSVCQYALIFSSSPLLLQTWHKASLGEGYSSLFK